VTSSYILEELGYVKRYEGNLKQDLIIHGHNTRRKLNFHVQCCNTVVLKEKCGTYGEQTIK